MEDLSLTVEEGDIFGFLGPNGAGKSTTIRCMLGMLKFGQGEIILLGKDSVREQKEILRQTGYMPSETAFYPGMKAGEIIRFAAEARGLDCREEAGRLCEELEVDKGKGWRSCPWETGRKSALSALCSIVPGCWFSMSLPPGLTP